MRFNLKTRDTKEANGSTHLIDVPELLRNLYWVSGPTQAGYDNVTSTQELYINAQICKNSTQKEILKMGRPTTNHFLLLNHMFVCKGHFIGPEKWSYTSLTT